MDSEKVAAHREALKQAERDGLLSAKAASATTNNPDWFIRLGNDAIPTPERSALHDRILDDWQNATTNPGRDKIAIMTAGPPGAGKTSARTAVQQRLSPDGWHVIDPDDFKDELLKEALEDGSFQRMAASMEQPDERFYPRELAPLVHEESTMLADKARERAIAAGENVVIDGTLAGRAKPDALAERLTAAGYTIHVVDVETTADVSRERVMGRWQGPYEEVQDKAAQGQDVSKELGGRWVNGEVVDFMYRGREDNDLSICADNAKALIDKHPAVQEVDRYYTPHAKGGAERLESWQRGDDGKVTHRTHEGWQTREQQSQQQSQQRAQQQAKEQAPQERTADVRSTAGQSKIEALRGKVGGREAAGPTAGAAGTKANSVPQQAKAQGKVSPQRDDKRREDRTRGQER
ncbi:zeta toxin family protein [Streptomyces sp. C36]|uniref:zeta toxin family protein n=1 Tax=Streptomyces sp. C36 TaxID=3237122 RepID=UPI0034C6B661